MKIGIDIHGVLDTNTFSAEMAKLFVAAGHEVHIITGAQFSERVKAKFSEMGIEEGVHYTHFFSIAVFISSRTSLTFGKRSDRSFRLKLLVMEKIPP